MTPTPPDQSAQNWTIGPTLSLTRDRPRIMGVLNVTPDSFSDGGDHLEPAAAVDRALAMIAEGADIIDIGGESTRPGSQRVDSATQIARTKPVIDRLRTQSDIPISIDTTRGDVALAALDAGANIINDVAAGAEDERIFRLAAERQCGLILMHRLVSPEHDSYSPQYAAKPEYDDVVAVVRRFLLQRTDAAMDAGVDRSAIAIDAGLGFGKSVAQNYELIARGEEFVATGYPVLCAASRKSFIGTVIDADDPRDRVLGSTAISVVQFLQGVRLFRVHDVRPHRDALAVAGAIGAAPAHV